MPTKSQINELSEILATALDQRPELKQRLSSLLSRRQMAVGSGKETMKQRKQKAREMFTGMHLKEKLKP